MVDGSGCMFGAEAGLPRWEASGRPRRPI